MKNELFSRELLLSFIDCKKNKTQQTTTKKLITCRDQNNLPLKTFSAKKTSTNNKENIKGIIDFGINVCLK